MEEPKTYQTKLVSDKFSAFSILSDAWDVTKIKKVKSRIILSLIKYEILSYLAVIFFIFISFMVTLTIYPNLAEVPENGPDPLMSPNRYILSCLPSLLGVIISPLIWQRSLNLIRYGEINYKRLFRNLKNPLIYITSCIGIYILGLVLPIILTFTSGFLIEKIFSPSIDNDTLYGLCFLVSIPITVIISFLTMFTNIIVLEKTCKKFKDIFTSMLISASHVRKHFLTYLGLTIITFILAFLSVLTIGIGFLWTLPLIMNMFAVAYEKENF